MAASHEIRSKTFPYDITRTSLKLSPSALLAHRNQQPKSLDGGWWVRWPAPAKVHARGHHYLSPVSQSDAIPVSGRRDISMTANSSENGRWHRTSPSPRELEKLATIFETGAADTWKRLHGRDWRTSGGSRY
ncbi:uncharacterized protein BDCG_01841 [Blastomyces dermatitidis ER-3]|uniref:Uncharacterized protein n=2 Tax=Ajellomyces dermatitidis TaxID=5039 RepID=F2TLZ4_AJEDA|nr:uncharacterized protein BDCG_01841 [Blastomyces dermatitidis ER-3]EEQ86721.2 hypothetical protein BDCG_01841 [Blastomyces dermatitidis ER-3]EGE84257.2 hypothetical protein BDDG_07202 [Blastomyces dermatitidis ATCC 18188]